MLMRFAFRKFPRALLMIFGALFFYSAAIAHPAHIVLHASQSEDSDSSHDGHCDLCLNFAALDSASAAPPTVLSLHEAAFAVVAVLSSFEYSHPIFFALGRGPPAV